MLHPHGGHDLRRRAAQRGAEARGLGQPQQRGRHHRRHPLPEARPRSWPVRHARRAVELLHEEPAPADPRRHRVQPGGGVHPRRGQRDAGRHRGPEEADATASSRHRRPRRPSPRSDRRRAPAGGAAPSRGSQSTDRRAVGRPGLPRHGVGPADRAGSSGRGADRAGRPGVVPAAGPPNGRWSNRNFGHVLGLPPDHPRVRRLALRAYRVYGDYLVELMRVPFMPTDEVVELIEPLDADEIARLRATAPNGGDHLHRRRTSAATTPSARPSPTSGLPLNAVADDSSFPELFDLLQAAARAVVRDDHPVAQSAGDLRRPAPTRAARPCSSTGAIAATGSR